MTMSPGGLRRLMNEEGVRLTAYKDPVGVWTIGVGHTGNVREGQTITAAEAQAILARDVARFEKAVTEQVHVSLTQNQFDALVSFVFNVGAGIGGFKTSTLRRLLNLGDYAGAAEQFLVWVHATDRKTGKLILLPGLVKRRQRERALFLTPDAPTTTT